MVFVKDILHGAASGGGAPRFVTREDKRLESCRAVESRRQERSVSPHPARAAAATVPAI